MGNEYYWPESKDDSGDITPESGSKKTWIFRIVCMLLFASGIAYYIILWIRSQYIITLNEPFLQNADLLSICIIAAIIIILVCFLRTLTKPPKLLLVSVIIAAVMLSGVWYAYFRYFPKYTELDACAIVKKDPKYASLTVEPHYNVYSDVKDNPFCIAGYILDVKEGGKVTLWILFDSATGRYETCEPGYQ